MTKHGIVREKHEFTLAKLRQINNIMLNSYGSPKFGGKSQIALSSGHE